MRQSRSACRPPLCDLCVSLELRYVSSARYKGHRVPVSKRHKLSISSPTRLLSIDVEFSYRSSKCCALHLFVPERGLGRVVLGAWKGRSLSPPRRGRKKRDSTSVVDARGVREGAREWARIERRESGVVVAVSPPRARATSPASCRTCIFFIMTQVWLRRVSKQTTGPTYSCARPLRFRNFRKVAESTERGREISLSLSLSPLSERLLLSWFRSVAAQSALKRAELPQRRVCSGKAREQRRSQNPHSSQTFPEFSTNARAERERERVARRPR